MFPDHVETAPVDPKQHRDNRLSLRTSAKQDALIRMAAHASSKTVTDFVLDSASQTAEQVLADRRWFLLDDDAWSAFNDLLERPVVTKPKLRELISQPSVFD